MGQREGEHLCGDKEGKGGEKMYVGEEGEEGKGVWEGRGESEV